MKIGRLKTRCLQWYSSSETCGGNGSSLLLFSDDLFTILAVYSLVDPSSSLCMCYFPYMSVFTQSPS
jgi:hypothetical protein